MPAGDTPTRPPQVTAAGWLAIVGGVVLVAALYDALGNVQTVELRRQLGEVLEQPGAPASLSVEDLLAALRVTVMVSAVLAASSAVLGGYVLQGHRGARVGLTVCGGLLVFGASLSGVGLAGLAVPVAAMLAWSPDARDWFAGRTPASRDAARSGAAGDTRTQGGARPRGGGPAADPLSAWRSSVPAPEARPAPDGGGQRSAAGGPQPWQAPADRTSPSSPRPRQVSEACVLAWVGSALVGLAAGVCLLALVIARGDVIAELEQQPALESLGAGAGGGELAAMLWIGCSVLLVWCLGAAIAAVAAWAGHRGGYWLLAASCAVTVLVALVARPTGGLVIAVLAGLALARLLSRRGRAWIRRPGPTG